ncbi:helix-turn-helix domain-containing protein [Caldalkalibacillus salinus]|uniref:helix-turn-helix domain-containing protein n=1 Tax=Caldalkalibacillus salinus TaxID=2803787 RepID=UPI0019206D91
MKGPYPEIQAVIAYIHEQIHEPLALQDLAKYAGYSPYHFSRIFKEQIGLSPLYYVSALRLQKAKDLLLQTNLSVRDIGLEIGQQSLGTFTTRFTDRVGVSPAHFRQSQLQTDQQLRSLQNLTRWHAQKPHHDPTIEGTIHTETPFKGIVFVGLFAKPIPEGLPLYGTIVSSEGHFVLPHVQPGTYYLMATSVSWGMHAKDILLPHQTLRGRSRSPITVKPTGKVPHQNVTLHPPRLGDPPILISLPLLMSRFLSRFNHGQQI